MTRLPLTTSKGEKKSVCGWKSLCSSLVCWQTRSRSGRPWEKDWSLTAKRRCHPSTAKDRATRDLSKCSSHTAAQSLQPRVAPTIELCSVCASLTHLTLPSSCLFTTDVRVCDAPRSGSWSPNYTLPLPPPLFPQESERQFRERELRRHRPARTGADAAAGERPLEIQPGVGHAAAPLSAVLPPFLLLCKNNPPFLPVTKRIAPIIMTRCVDRLQGSAAPRQTLHLQKHQRRHGHHFCVHGGGRSFRYRRASVRSPRPLAPGLHQF